MKVLDTVEVVVRLKEKIQEAKKSSDNSVVNRLENLLDEIIRNPKKSFL